MKEFIKKNPPRFWFLVGLIPIIILVAVGVFFCLTAEKKDKNVLAIVGGEKITKTDLDNELYGISFTENSNANDDTKKYFLDYAIEKKIIEQNAKRLGIEVTQKEIDEEIATTLQTQPDKKDGGTVFATYNAKQKSLTTDNITYNIRVAKIKDRVLGWNEGKYLLVRFDKYYADLPEFSKVALEDESKRDGLNKEMRQKATVVADRLYQKLSAGADWVATEDELAADKEVGYPALDPVSPTMAGELTKTNYFDAKGLTDLAQFSEFNELAAKSVNKITEPTLVKDQSGKELPFFIIYKGSTTQNGYKWGYANWLESQRKELLAVNTLSNSVLALLDKITPQAKAFAGQVCGTTGYGHGYCMTIETFYINRSGVRTPIVGYPLRISGYTTNNVKGVTNMSGSNWSIIEVRTASDGVFWMSARYPSLTGQYESNAMGYGVSMINCNVTGVYYVTLIDWANGVNPVIAGTTGAGSWGLTSSLPAPYAWLQNNWGSRIRVCLRKSTTCTVGSLTANGKVGAHSYQWYPTWAPTEANITATVSLEANGVVTANPAVGKVTSTLSGGSIDCGNGGSACGPTSATIGSNNKVNAIPAPNYSFVRWMVNGVAQPTGWNEMINVADSTAITVNAVFRYSPVATACAFSPQTGLSPLVVRVEPSGGVGPYSINMGDGSPALTNRTSPVYYTYAPVSTVTRYTITITDSLGTVATCAPMVTINPNQSGTGGEVAP